MPQSVTLSWEEYNSLVEMANVNSKDQALSGTMLALLAKLDSGEGVVLNALEIDEFPKRYIAYVMSAGTSNPNEVRVMLSRRINI